MALNKNAKLRRAIERKDTKRVKEIRAQIRASENNPVGEGCGRCPEDSLAACFGDKCATKCCGPPEGEYKPTQVVPIDHGKPEKHEMRRGGRKTRRKRRKKRRKSRKKRKKTKRRRKRRRKKSKKVRRK